MWNGKPQVKENFVREMKNQTWRKLYDGNEKLPVRDFERDLWWPPRLILCWGRRMSSRWVLLLFVQFSNVFSGFSCFLAIDWRWKWNLWQKLVRTSTFWRNDCLSLNNVVNFRVLLEMWLLVTFAKMWWHFAVGLRVHGESWHDYKPSKHCHQHLLLLIIMILIINVISLAISRTRNQLKGATSIIHKSDNTPTTTTTTTTYPPLHHHLHLIVTISCRSALSGRVESSTEISPTT